MAGTGRPAPLREQPCRQQAGEPPRRWFTSSAADLYVWTRGKRVVGFEFCYGKERDEHSLRWRARRGFAHTGIDEGQDKAGRNRSPIAVADGRVDYAAIAAQFDALARDIDPAVAKFVARKLRGR